MFCKVGLGWVLELGLVLGLELVLVLALRLVCNSPTCVMC